MAENKDVQADSSSTSCGPGFKESDRESRSMDRQTPPDARSTPPQPLAGAGAIYSAFSDAKVSNLQQSKKTKSDSPLDMTTATLDGPCRKLSDRKSHSRTGSENSELEAALSVEIPKSSWKTPPRAMSPIEFEDRSPESPVGSLEASNKSSGTGSGRSSNVKDSIVDEINEEGWRDDGSKNRLTPPSSGSARSRSANDKKKKASNWYNVLSPSYKSRTEDFKKLFKDVPSSERLIVDYSCAMQKDILVHGRLYVTQNWICFYANIFRWETVITIRCKEIQAITKEKTARVIPNAIQILTDREKYFFTSFAARDKSFLMLFRVWQNALMDQPMSAQELWQWVHYCYGDELGLTSSDEDYVPPSQEDAANIQARLGIDLPEADEDEQEQDDLADSSFAGDPPLIGLPPFPGMNASTDDGCGIPQAAAAAEPKRRKPMPPSSLPVPSPDATSGDLPTDLGDTTEDSDGGEVYCGNHEHTGTTSVDNVFNASVDQLFEMIFCPSAFMDTIRREEKTFDVNAPPWPDEINESGNKVRELSYTITSTFSFGPKHIPSTEKQTLHAESQPGLLYVVDCECVQLGIPYGDSFYVLNRYCLTKVSKSRTRLRVTSDIRYKKSVWGLVKSIIVKNCNIGISSYFQHLEQNLQKELDKGAQPPPIAQGSRKKLLRRRRNPSDRVSATKWQAEQGGSAQGSPAKNAATKDEWQIEINMDMVVRIMFIGMLVLMVINAVLFYKFFSLEKKASILQYQTRREPWFSPGCNSPPDAQDGWSGGHTEHKYRPPVNVETWKEVLETNIQLIDQMKKTLTFLYNNLDIPHQPPSQPDSKD